MIRLLRISMALVAILASVAAPCMPAWAGRTGCAMAGCEKDAPSLSGAMPCCCDVAGAPAEASSLPGAAAAFSPMAGCGSLGVHGPAGLANPVTVLESKALVASSFYILHTALLM